MNRINVRTAVVALAAAGMGSAALAQAPASAQVWDVRFRVEGAGPDVNAVTITLLARVGIKPNSSGSGTANLGVSRVGGPLNTFVLSAVDPSAAAGASFFERGVVPGLAADGAANLGTYSEFRQGFAPAGTNGFNTDPQNGQLSVAGNTARVTSLVQSRQTGFNGVPLGVATLDAAGAITGGEYAEVYRLVYYPKFGDTRDISVSVTGLSARYLFANQGGGNASAGTAVNLPNQSFTFQVPAPGAAAVIGVAGLAAARRRRA